MARHYYALEALGKDPLVELPKLYASSLTLVRPFAVFPEPWLAPGEEDEEEDDADDYFDDGPPPATPPASPPRKRVRHSAPAEPGYRKNGGKGCKNTRKSENNQPPVDGLPGDQQEDQQGVDAEQHDHSDPGSAPGAEDEETDGNEDSDSSSNLAFIDQLVEDVWQEEHSDPNNSRESDILNLQLSETDDSDEDAPAAGPAAGEELAEEDQAEELAHADGEEPGSDSSVECLGSVASGVLCVPPLLPRRFSGSSTE